MSLFDAQKVALKEARIRTTLYSHCIATQPEALDKRLQFGPCEKGHNNEHQISRYPRLYYHIIQYGNVYAKSRGKKTYLGVTEPIFLRLKPKLV